MTLRASRNDFHLDNTTGPPVLIIPGAAPAGVIVLVDWATAGGAVDTPSAGVNIRFGG
jgi:hypothetical protein